MRIGILTGGGDVPGLNACIKAAVNRATAEGHQVLGIRRGWGGLLGFDPDDPDANRGEFFEPLDPVSVRTIDRSGGAILLASRTSTAKVKPKRVPGFLQSQVEADAEGPFDFTAHVLRVIEHERLDVLMPIGGDDTLSYGLRLHQEGVPIIAIPKTMDNDVHGT